MLTVVQHQQRFPVAQRLEQGVPRRSDSVAPHAQRVGHVVRDELGIRQGRQLHPRDPFRVPRRQAARHLESETGFPAAADTGKGQEPSAL